MITQDSASAQARNRTRYREMRKVTLVGSAVDLGLGVLKVVVGSLAHSQALIADGIHSLSDLSTDVAVLVAARHAHRGADADHPYGHGRIETATTVGLGVVLVLVAFGIAYDAVSRLFHPERLLVPEAPALAAAALSVIAKEAVYRYTMRYARRLRSNLLRANAWHSRSDALSSVAVIVGVSGAMAGLTYVDAIAAVVVAGMIAKIGWEVGWPSVRELIDTGLEPEELAEIRERIMAVDGVQTLHRLRTRRMGGKTLVDVHITLEDPKLSVSEGHQISETVRSNLLAQRDDVLDVTVHIDPEDDEHAAPNRHLPLRREVLERLGARWAGLDGAEAIDDVILHYVSGRIDVEVLLPFELARDVTRARARAEAFAAALAGEPEIGEVRVLYADRPRTKSVHEGSHTHQTGAGR